MYLPLSRQVDNLIESTYRLFRGVNSENKQLRSTSVAETKGLKYVLPICNTQREQQNTPHLFWTVAVITWALGAPSSSFARIMGLGRRLRVCRPKSIHMLCVSSWNKKEKNEKEREREAINLESHLWCTLSIFLKKNNSVYSNRFLRLIF